MADAKEAADVGDVKHAGLKRKLDLVLQYVKILFEGNPLLLHFTLLPIAFFACYLLGWFITWVTVLVLSISLMTQRISERKKEFYDRAALELAAKERKDVETCEWLNTLVKKYCTTCMESHVLPVIKEQLQNNQVPLVTKMSVKKCNFGESFPRIESANTVRGLSSRNYQTDFMLTFNSDAYIEVKLVLVKGMKVIIRVDEVYISGNLRLKMHFNAEFPALSTASVCFVDDPVISFSVKAMNSGDLMSLLGPIEEMIMQAIQTPIREEMVFPQVLCWNFSGERQTADKPSGPIADIQVIFKKEKYVPPNYKVLSKSISGTGTGNVNSKIGDDIYLCYKPKKDSDAETLPVTGICVVQSYLDPKDRGFLRLFPPDFMPYITTASTTIANLNGGNSGIPTFLGFRRDNINPPITHIGLYNKTVNEHLPPNYSILFATPDGGKANLNAGVPKADEVYLVYQGGTPSSFGYLKPPVAPGERGTLQVTVISGEGLKIADITGSSDPFAVVYVGSPGSKAPSGSEKTRTIYKNLDPIWNDTFLLRAAPGDCLHIQMYDEDPGLRNDKLGIAVIPLDNLERGKPLERSYKLQKVSRGRVKINVVALDFGLEPTETPYNKESFTQISVENKKNSSTSNVFKEDHGDDDTSESVDITKMEYKFKDGFVEKLPSQRNILYSGWKRRWCVLRQESLCFSKHKDSNSEPKSISLIGAKLETNNETGQIIVRRDGKTLTMRVGGSEFDQWVSFLKNNILVATARNPLHYSSSSSGSISRDPKDESSEQAPVSSSSNEPALTRSASRALKRLKK